MYFRDKTISTANTLPTHCSEVLCVVQKGNLGGRGYQLYFKTSPSWSVSVSTRRRTVEHGYTMLVNSFGME